MDKKSTVKDLYQKAVISVLAAGYSMLGKKILHMALPSSQKFDLEDAGKLIRDDQRVSHQTEDLTRSHQCMRKWRL